MDKQQIMAEQNQSSDQEFNQNYNNQDITKQNDGFILDAKQFLKFAKADKKIKIMDECNPILPYVYLKDISLHKKGPMEDKMYAKYSKYFKNIRRGNTLCQIYNKESNLPQKLFFCRRGMVKFYDLEPEYLKVNTQLTYYENNVKRIIFSQLDKHINSQNYKIHLYRLFKQNGQHCQISYVRQLDYWLFASKNVSILAKSQEDLKNNYHKQRFYWAKLIGQQFFKIINNFTQNQKQQFVKDIQGKTLLGQHCGNQNHQHITIYDKVQIIFYAIVQNVGTTHCIPVEDCQEFLKKYNLKMSRIKSVKDLQGKTQVYQNIYKMLEKTATGTIDQQGQGSVLYIVGQDLKTGEQKTISLCKLKTTQYLILRKLRQMLKINATKKGATANTLKKFIFDIENLVQKYFKPPKSLKIYFKMAQNAFKEVASRNDEIDQTFLRYKFSGFINNLNNEQVMKQIKQQVQQQEIIMKEKQIQGLIKRIVIVGLPFLNNKIQKYAKSCKIGVQYNLKPNQLTEKPAKSIIHLLTMVPRLPDINKIPQENQIIIVKYSQKQLSCIIKQLSQSTEIKNKPHLINFIKSQDKQKSIQLLIKKIQGFSQQCLKQGRKVIISGNIHSQKGNQQQIIQIIKNLLTKSKQTIEQLQKQQEQNQNKPLFYKYVILPLLIPGSGKSLLASQLLSFINQNHPEIPFKIVHSDGIRKQIIDKKKKERAKNGKNQLEQTEWFKISKQEAALNFRKQIHKQLDKIPSYANQLLYIDRVICPTTLLQNLQQYFRPYVKFVFLTQTTIPFKFSQYDYPFSLKYLLICLKRCLQRENHQTLTTKPYQIAKVVLKYFQMYRNFNFGAFIKNIKDQNIRKNIIKTIQLDFVKVQNQKGANVNNFLKKKVQQCLKLINPGFDPKQGQCFTELIEMLYKYNDYTEQDSSELKMVFQNQLTKSFWIKIQI